MSLRLVLVSVTNRVTNHRRKQMGYFQRLLLDQLETDDEFRLDFEDEEIWRLETDFPDTTICTAFNEEF